MPRQICGAAGSGVGLGSMEHDLRVGLPNAQLGVGRRRRDSG